MPDPGLALTALAGVAPSVTSLYPCFLICTLLLGAAAIISRKAAFYRALADEESRSPRFHAVDGLRGFLALAVFFHHAVISYYFHQHGRWEVPPSQFYTLCGQVAVGLFFMITAFLFWSKGLGRGAAFPVQAFFWSRITRLVPMYLASVVCVFAVAAFATGFRLADSPAHLVRQFFLWSSFGFLDRPEINGLKDSGVINTVYWSLRYEWLFYLFLPLGLVFARGVGFALLAGVAALAIHWASVGQVEWNFLFGAGAALVLSDGRFARLLNWQGRAVSVVIAALLVLLFAVFDSGYGLRQSLLLFAIFLGVANGNSLSGLLTCRAARFLGTISFSVYLMHSVVLYAGLRLVDGFVPIEGMNAGLYWALTAVIGLAVVGLSSLTYRAIEHPLLKMAMPAWLGSGKAGGAGRAFGPSVNTAPGVPQERAETPVPARK